MEMLRFESAAKLDAMLMCLEPFERHFDEKLREVNLLLYWDSANAFLAEIEWPCLPESSAVFRIGYTFKNREKMNEMVADIDSAKAGWSNEAVPKHTLTMRVPNSALKSKKGRVIVIRQVDVPTAWLAEVASQ